MSDAGGAIEAPVNPHCEIDLERFEKFSTDYFLENGVFVSFSEAQELFSDQPLVTKAIQFAESFHSIPRDDKENRRSGHSYTEGHLIPLACLAANRFQEYEENDLNDGDLSFEDRIVVAILHDSIEDTEATKELIAEFFGTAVADCVGALTKPPKHDYASYPEHEKNVMRANDYCQKIRENAAKYGNWLIDLKIMDNSLNLFEDIIALRNSELGGESRQRINNYAIKSLKNYYEIFDVEENELAQNWYGYLRQVINCSAMPLLEV